jgi:hypothetical protein
LENRYQVLFFLINLFQPCQLINYTYPQTPLILLHLPLSDVFPYTLCPFPLAASFSINAAISSGIGDSKTMNSPVWGWVRPSRQACSICLGTALSEVAFDDDSPENNPAGSFNHLPEQ